MALFAVCFALPAVPETTAAHDAPKPVAGQAKENMKTDATFFAYGYYPYVYPNYYSGLAYKSKCSLSWSFIFVCILMYTFYLFRRSTLL